MNQKPLYNLFKFCQIATSPLLWKSNIFIAKRGVRSLLQEPRILDSRWQFVQWPWTSDQIASRFSSVFLAAKWGYYYLPTSQWEGRGLWGPEVWNGLWWSVRTKFWHEVHGYFSNARDHWPLKKDRECCRYFKAESESPWITVPLKRETCIGEYFTF